MYARSRRKARDSRRPRRSLRAGWQTPRCLDRFWGSRASFADTRDTFVDGVDSFRDAGDCFGEGLWSARTRSHHPPGRTLSADAKRPWRPGGAAAGSWSLRCRGGAASETRRMIVEDEDSFESSRAGAPLPGVDDAQQRAGGWPSMVSCSFSMLFRSNAITPWLWSLPGFAS